jgi:hypothetical protein
MVEDAPFVPPLAAGILVALAALAIVAHRADRATLYRDPAPQCFYPRELVGPIHPHTAIALLSFHMLRF